MFSKQFKLKEVVDGIDDCFIWWQAEKVRFNGEWEVVVRWIAFGKKIDNKHLSTVRNTSEKWNIRKKINPPQTLPYEKSRYNKIQLYFKANFQSRGDTIKFFQGEYVRKGFVFINGTVLLEMEVLGEDEYRKGVESTEEYDKLMSSFRTLQIRYYDLRRLVAPNITDIDENDNSDQSDAEIRSISQKSRQKLQHARRKSRSICST